MKTKAIFYGRTSADDDMKVSIDAQQADYLKACISNLKAKTVQRYKDLESGFLDRDTFKALTEESKALETSLSKSLKDLDIKIADSVSRIKLTTQSKADLANLSAPTYQSLIRSILDKVLIYSDKIEIHLHPDLGWKQSVFTIKRIPYRNQMLLPTPIVTLQEPVDNPDTITTEVIITYPQPNAKPVTFFFD